MSAKKMLTKAEFDFYLAKLATLLKKEYGKGFEGELIVVGGAAILANYHFRTMSADIDAIIRANARIKDAINKISDVYDLPSDWLNSDFVKTTSFSGKLAEVSRYYRSFCNGVLTVRTVNAEYLIAMKLRSFRPYKKDLSDIVGIIGEHDKEGNSITIESIIKAYKYLYDAELPDKALLFLQSVFDNNDILGLYQNISEQERKDKIKLIDFENKYPGVLSEDNLEDILQNLNNHNSGIAD